MEPGLRRRLQGYAEAVELSRYRGLLVLHSAEPGRAAEELVELLGGRGGCIAAAPRRLLPSCPGGCRCVSPGGFQRALGQEARLVVIATDGLLRPSLAAGLAGAVSAGGLLAVTAPPLDMWSPGPTGGAGGYRRYLLDALRRAPSCSGRTRTRAGCTRSGGPTGGPGSGGWALGGIGPGTLCPGPC